jgi:hypothetical protein
MILIPATADGSQEGASNGENGLRDNHELRNGMLGKKKGTFPLYHGLVGLGVPLQLPSEFEVLF